MEEPESRRAHAHQDSGQSQGLRQRSDGQPVETHQETPHGPHAPVGLARQVDLPRDRAHQRKREADFELHVPHGGVPPTGIPQRRGLKLQLGLLIMMIIC